MFLTKSVLCGMMMFVMAGCATSGYNVRSSVGVDYHVNATQQPEPNVSFRMEITPK